LSDGSSDRRHLELEWNGIVYANIDNIPPMII